jgi:hypothetical protein
MTDQPEAQMPQPKGKRERKAKASRTPIMHIPAPIKKPWDLTAEEVELVRSHIAKGASDDELKFCLGVARRYKLDPFRGQIWFVKRRDRQLDRYDKEKKEKVTGYRWIPIVGINGLLHVAARDHKKDFGSYDEPEYGPLVDVEWSKYDETNRKYVPQKPFKAPEWARVACWKRGMDRPTVATIYWAEIYPNVDAAPMVRQMPRLMLGKCAKAAATRTAYPATDGLYVQEEFMVEQCEPSSNAQRSMAKVEEIDKRLLKFKELNGGKNPTDEQLSRLETGESPEQVLLQDSLKATQSIDEQKVQEIWPRQEKLEQTLFGA